MQIPSLDRLARSAAGSLRRFPLVLAAALVATAAGLALVEHRGSDLWERVLGVATLGLPLAFALTLLAERRGWDGPARWGLQGLGAAVLTGVFLAWPGWTDPVAARRWVQLAAGFHLLAAFLPFASLRETRGFWQYNRSLFLRFLTGALYAAVLFAGLALALAALDRLFGIPVPSDAYPKLWVVLALLVHPWFFISGVPEDLSALQDRTDYPRGLEVFAQYVLVPLVGVYLVILTAYAGKVLVTWEWPSGWIGGLVSGVAVAGILAALLVHPVRDEAEHRWVRVYGRWFWPALLPSVVLLAIAVGKRIDQYGVTENRYFLAVLAAWLGSVAVYYTVRGFERPERIPRSLCVLALVTFVGPWSAYSVSEASQRGRLEGLLAEHGLVVDGVVRPAEDHVPVDDRREISATVRYLLRVHGPGALAPAFGGEVPGAAADTVAGVGRDERADAPAPGSDAPTPEKIVAALGLEYVDRSPGPEARRFFGVRAGEPEGAIPLGDYRMVVPRLSSDRSAPIAVPEAAVAVRVDAGGVELARGDEIVLELSVVEAPFLREVARHDAGRGPARGRRPPGELWIRAEGGGLRAALWIEQLSARRADDGTVTVRRWRGDLYLGWGTEAQGNGR